MIRLIALSALAALTIGLAPTPSLAQTGVPGASAGSVQDHPDCKRGDRCREGRNRPGTIAGGRAEPREPPGGYYRNDPRPDPRPRPPRHYDPPRPPPGYYRPPVYETRDRVSCREARQIVREEGYRDVRAVDCEGRTYQFEARRKGRFFLVVVSARSGDIVDVSRL